MMLLDIDPNVVKPGWTPLIITIALAVVIVLLYLSMRRQFHRINVNLDQPAPADETAAVPSVPQD